MDKELMINKTCTPRKPPKIESMLSRVRKELLAGGIINRKTLGEKGIAVTNGSLHSTASILRNEKFIPIESDRQNDHTVDYSMLPREIVRYNDPVLRQQQQEEMFEHVEEKRKDKIIKGISKYLGRLDDNPKLWKYLPDLPSLLDSIVKEISACLEKKKDAN